MLNENKNAFSTYFLQQNLFVFVLFVGCLSQQQRHLPLFVATATATHYYYYLFALSDNLPAFGHCFCTELLIGSTKSIIHLCCIDIFIHFQLCSCHFKCSCHADSFTPFCILSQKLQKKENFINNNTLHLKIFLLINFCVGTD